MESESSVMRMLQRVQRTVPDRDFFMHTYRRKEKGAEQRKGKSGLFAGGTFLGRKKKPKFNLIKAREQIRAFHNAFLANTERDYDSKAPEIRDTMSIPEMNAFRQKIREAAAVENADVNYLAMDGVIKYIDLKNSAVVSGKQNVLLDCLRKVGAALVEDGGLSMFHTTWFLSMYKEYLARFKLPANAELQQTQQGSEQEAKMIARRLIRKQFEIPQYLQLVDDKVIEVKMINHYSKDILVKMSRHGQQGCTASDIKKIFLENFKHGSVASNQKGKVNDVGIIMAYALFFARIPMMDQLVENIRNAIPNVNTEAAIYKQKIVIAQKISLLEVARALHQSDASEKFMKKLNLLAHGVFNYCVKVIQENQLDRVELKNDIYIHLLLKQAVIAITYKNIFRRNQDSYLKLLESSKKLLKAVTPYASSGHQTIQKLAGQANVYSKAIETIIQQINKEHSAGYDESDFGDTHQNF
ncbi:MAG: hypothetical protein HN580_18080 [Deltaproteobacteria bacterium]|nr:hypothetical protein [Deltaproteobacteria bacterium]MBT7890931.1 hypothetical protein [Deltaproteobacteria bacterium]